MRDGGSLNRAEIDALADRIAETAVHIDSATHRLLTQIREFDDAGGWHLQGALSCAHWLSYRIGLGLGAGREKVRIARALGTLPAIDQAFARGELSFSKVRAMSRVATADNEAALLHMATSCPASQLEKVCRLYRQVHDMDPANAPPAPTTGGRDDRRWVRSRVTDDGLMRIEIQLSADEAALLMKAIDVSAESCASVTTAGERRLDRADGVVALADSVLRGGGDLPRTPTEVIIHVDADTLRGHLEDGTGIPAETSRRLCCDAGIVMVTTDSDGTPLDVGRKQRTVPPAIRRALAIRDQGCRFPGCENHRFVDAHHIEHWSQGGATSLANTILLCRSHHRAVHELGFTIEACGEGASWALRFRDPRGRVIEPVPARPVIAREGIAILKEQAMRDGLRLDRNTALPKWHGEPLDHDTASACIDVLLNADRTRTHAS